MTQLQEDLQTLRGLLARGWTQGTMARDELGRGVVPQSRNAVCWCLLGGMDRATWGIGPEFDERHAAVCEAIRAVLPATGEGAGSILYFNENEKTTQRDVLELVDRAINKVENAQ